MPKILGGSQRDAIAKAILRRSRLYLRSIGGSQQREPVQDPAFSSRWLRSVGHYVAPVASAALSALERRYGGNFAVQVSRTLALTLH